MLRQKVTPLQIIHPRTDRGPGILVIHSWWGLTTSFRTFGSKLAERGFAVGLADLFGGATAGTEADARRLRAAPCQEPMYKTLLRNLDELRTAPCVQPHGLGVVGFSMGGHWAIWLSQRPDADLRAAVVYYAARSGRFDRARAAYLGHFAENDPWVSRRGRRTMERAIAAAGLRYVGYDYPGTGHWFAEPNRPESYAPRAARTAFQRTVDHLRGCFPTD